MPVRHRRAAAALLALAPFTAASALAAPDMSGRWRRNTEASQEAATRIVEAVGARDRDIHDLEKQQLRDRLLKLAKGAETFEIEQSEKEFKVVAGGDHVRIFYPTGEHRRDSSEGLKIRVSSRWSADEIVVQQKLEDGDHITERFSLKDGQLVHDLHWTSARLQAPLTVRTVYDRAEE